jgi:hypothetical protein
VTSRPHTLAVPRSKTAIVALAAVAVALVVLAVVGLHATSRPGSSGSGPRGVPASTASGVSETDPAGIPAVADTYVVPAHPGRNFGHRAYLFATATANRAFLRFDTEGAVPAGRSVRSATLHLYVTHVAAVAPGFEVHPTSNDWAEQHLTADNRPAFRRDVVSGTVPELATGRWVAVPISAGAVSASGPTSFELLHRTPQSNLQFASRESGRGPRLELTLSGSVVRSPGAGTGPTTAQSSDDGTLPIDVPAAAGSGRSSRLAFAHYFPPYPVSLDNGPPERDYYERAYREPRGEGGRHKAFGGLLRDRPIGREPRSGDWQAKDMRDEVRQAMAAGLDGFAVDILSVGTGNWRRTLELLRAAHEVSPSFKVLLMPDMTAMGRSQTPESLARTMKLLAEFPAAMRLPDGRLVVSPFKAEEKSTQWWSRFLGEMRTTQQTPVAFVPTFLNWTQYADEFAPISYGFSTWGNSNPAFNVSAGTNAARAHGLGKIWMAPVRVQDVRPRSGVYEEPENTTTIRQTWTTAVTGGADWVVLNTWNDYSEGTSFAPSAHHGWSFLDISTYYLAWWRTGRRPTVVRDAIYLTHRVQPHAARPTFPQQLLMTPPRDSTPPRDTVEALVFLARPATVTLRMGTHEYRWDAPAGVSAHIAPLSTGTVAAAVERDGQVATSVESPYRVRKQPPVQDLEYYAVSSLRR